MDTARQPGGEGRSPHFDLLLGTGWVREEIDAGRLIAEVAAPWQAEVAEYHRLRRPCGPCS